MPALDYEFLGKDVSASAVMAKLGLGLEKLQAKAETIGKKPIIINTEVNDHDSSAKMKELAAQQEELDRKGKKLSGGGLKSMSSGLAGVAAVIGIASGATVDLAVKYDESTNKLAAASGSSVKSAKAISDAFLTIGDKATFSAPQIEAAFTPVSAKLAEVNGHALNVQNSMDFMNAAMNAAEATGGDLNATASALANVMGAYGLKTKDAGVAADVMSNTSRLTNTTVQDLAVGMDKLHAKLGVLAPSLADTGALAASLAQHGLAGNKGMLTVNAAMTTLTGGSKKVSAEIGKLKLHVTDAHGKFVGFGSILEQLSPKLGKMNEKQRVLAEQTLFGAGAAGAMNGVIADGPAKFAALSDKIGEAGSAHEAAEKATAGLKAQMERLKNGTESMAITFGQKLIPYLIKGVQHLKTFGEWVERNSKVLLPLVGYLGAAAGGILIITKAMEFWGKVTKLTTAIQKLFNIEMAANPFALIIIGIVLAVGAFIYFWKKSAAFRDFWKNIWKDIQLAVRVVVDWFHTSVVPRVESVWKKIKSGVEEFKRIWDEVWGKVTKIVDAFLGWFRTNIAPGLHDIFSQASGAAKAFGDVIGIIFKVIVAPVKWAFGQMVSTVKVGFSVITAIAKVAWDIIVPVAKVAWAVLVAIFKAGLTFIENVWRPVWNGLVKILEGVWKIIYSVIAGAFQVLKGIFEVFVGVFTGNWSKAWKGITDIFGGIWRALSGVLSGVLKILQGLIQIFVGVIVSYFKALGTFFSTIWHDIWSAIGGWVKRIVNDVIGWFKNLGAGIKTYVLSLADEQKKRWADIWNSITGFAKRIWNDVTGFFKKMWDGIRNTFVQQWDKEKKGWQNILDTLGGIAKNIWTKVSGFFSSMWKDIRSTFTKQWDNEKRGWQNVLDTLGGIAKNIWTKVSGFFSSMWKDIGGLAKKGWDAELKGWQNIGKSISDIATNIWHTVVNAFTNMKNGLIDIFKALANNVFVKPINFVINTVIDGGINGLLHTVGKVFGQNWGVHVNPIPGFATGGLVPGAGNRDNKLIYATPGEGIIRKDRMQQLGGKRAIDAINGGSKLPSFSGGIQHYSIGGLIGDIGHGISNVAGSIGSGISNAVGTVVGWARGAIGATASKVLSSTIYPLADHFSSPGLIGQLPHDITHKIGDALVKWLNGKDQSAPGGPISFNAGAGVKQWDPLILRALAALGQPATWLQTVERRMNQESGGNPNAINNTDINAQRGDPSKGLMQVISGTFAAYKPGGANNVYDPYSNIYAGLNYALHRYGSLSALNKPGGYFNGGIADHPQLAALGEAGKELILPLTKPRRVAQLLNEAGLSGGQGSTVHKHYSLTVHAREFSVDDLRAGFKRLEALDGAST